MARFPSPRTRNLLTMNSSRERHRRLQLDTHERQLIDDDGRQQPHCYHQQRQHIRQQRQGRHAQRPRC